jgi:hypothetical protein
MSSCCRSQLGWTGDQVTASDDSAEVVWRDTEARSFGVMADGILKISQALAAGLPIEPFLPLLPGLTQQMIGAIKKQTQAQAQAATVTDLINSLRPAAQAAGQDPQVSQLAGQKNAQSAPGDPGMVGPDLLVRPMTVRG